jgi:uncharacterized protein
MLPSVPFGEIVLLVGLILVGGVVTGILAGLFGIGGGALIVPVLYEVFGALGVSDAVRFQVCVGTSIAIIVPTNLSSFRAHRARGAVLMEIVRAWAIPAIAGGCRICAGRGAQARVRDYCKRHCGQAVAGP